MVRRRNPPLLAALGQPGRHRLWPAAKHRRGGTCELDKRTRNLRERESGRGGALFSPRAGTEPTRPCGTRQADVGRDVARPLVHVRMQADHVGTTGDQKFAGCLGA
jgi:hypothetical protein